MAEVYQQTLELARQLIARRSVTPDDAGCLDVLSARLSAVGFTCERIDRGAVRNLWARRGTGAPLVCLAGHVDVVPPGPVERWTSDPFTPTERDGCLFGRGAADMKVGVAAMTTAAERFVAASPDHSGSVALLFTSDEEGAGVEGTRAVVRELQARGERIDACIIGEPTSVSRLGDTIKNGRRGSLNGVLTVKGVQCHIAYPERGKSPILPALPALAKLAATEWDRGNEYFSPTSFQISDVHAGTGANNTIPGSMEVWFNFRFSTESTEEGLKSRVHAVLDAHGLDYDLKWALSGAPFLSPRGGLVDVVTEAVRTVTGVTPALSTSGGTSDGRFLAGVSREVLEFGPVSASIHGIDEHVNLADIAPLSQIYEHALRALLA
ncbi:MAG TPA: succinyl-diaminopimelate desuccinylase [Vicinamibacterales bacterium]|jgi:succinyl-diaminopimelate desuccinylase|nr:succinyl-diaminopimelate desuccinylase [Vicinamibacterales bacterium]